MGFDTALIQVCISEIQENVPRAIEYVRAMSSLSEGRGFLWMMIDDVQSHLNQRAAFLCRISLVFYQGYFFLLNSSVGM